MGINNGICDDDGDDTQRCTLATLTFLLTAMLFIFDRSCRRWFLTGFVIGRMNRLNYRLKQFITTKLFSSFVVRKIIRRKQSWKSRNETSMRVTTARKRISEQFAIFSTSTAYFSCRETTGDTMRVSRISRLTANYYHLATVYIL